MNVQHWFLWILLLMVSATQAQDPGRILGIVTNSVSGDSLDEVNVVVAGTPIKTTTNTKGAYLLQKVPAARQTVIFSKSGFVADTVRNVKLNPGQTYRLDAELLPLSAVPAHANRILTTKPEPSQVGVQTINPQKVQRLAGAFDDFNRVVSILPDAVSSSDYTGAYAVRGGTLDQNVVYFDGLIIPNPYRLRLLLGGGFGLFNTATTRRVDFYTSHFPGQYGNFLSSAMSITSRQGRRDRFGASGSLDFLQTRATLEGPLPDKRGSWLASMRRSYMDLFTGQIAGDQSVFPYMFDFDSKLVYDLSDNTQISYKTLYTQEAAKLVAETDEDVEIDESTRSALHTLALESQLSDHAFASVRAGFYNETFDYNLYADKTDPNAASGDYASRLESILFDQHLSLELGDNHRIDQGVYVSSETSQLDLVSNVVNIGFTRRDLPPDMLFDQNTGRVATYVDYSATFARQFESVVGLRYDYSELFKDDDVSAKLSLLYHIDPHMQAHAFWGKVVQYPNVTSVFTRDMPLDFSADPARLHSETATHYVLGLNRQWPYNISTRLQLYFKSYDRLLLPQDRVYFTPDNNGEGYSQGFDLTVEKTRGENDWFSGLISYSYGKSEYRDKEEKVWIPFNYDRRHGIRALADATIYKNWGANVVWRFDSGLPYNEIYGYTWNVNDRSRYLKSDLKQSRYAAYSRFDLRVYYRKRSATTRWMVYLDLINLFNRKNIYERMYYTIDAQQEEGPTIRTFKYANIYNMPFVPSLGVSVWY